MSKYRFLLSAKWIGFTLGCLLLIVVMVNLAFWQMRRLDEKKTFNREVRAVAEAPVKAYEDVVPGDDAPEGVQYQRVEVTGTYLPREFEIVNVSQDGNSGHDQVAALQLDDGSLLIVNRGFTTGTEQLPELPTEPVTVLGRIRYSSSTSGGIGKDDGSQQLTQIRRVDLGVLGQQFEQPLQPVYLEMLAENDQAVSPLVPIAFPGLSEGPHLSYTIQWFLFSVFVVIGWVLAVRTSASNREEAAREAAGEPPKKRKKALIPEQYLTDDGSTVATRPKADQAG